jgi:hypothetical protein
MRRIRFHGEKLQKTLVFLTNNTTLHMQCGWPQADPVGKHGG